MNSNYKLFRVGTHSNPRSEFVEQATPLNNKGDEAK